MKHRRLGSYAGVLNGHSDIPGVETDVNRPANTPNSVRTPRKRGKPPDSPSRNARQRSDELNGCGNHANRSSICTDMPSTGCDMEMVEDKVETISMRPIESKLPNPLTMAQMDAQMSRTSPGTMQAHRTFARTR